MLFCPVLVDMACQDLNTAKLIWNRIKGMLGRSFLVKSILLQFLSNKKFFQEARKTSSKVHFVFLIDSLELIAAFSEILSARDGLNNSLLHLAVISRSLRVLNFVMDILGPVGSRLPERVVLADWNHRRGARVTRKWFRPDAKGSGQW